MTLTQQSERLQEVLQDLIEIHKRSQEGLAKVDRLIRDLDHEHARQLSRSTPAVQAMIDNVRASLNR